MTAVRHPALWLAAAIAMIGVWLMPAAANAHTGHEHRAVAADVATFDTDHAGFLAQAVETASNASSERAGPEHACTSPCCGSAGHAHCCGCVSGLVPDETLTLAPPIGVGRLPMGAVSGHGPVVPEALPEPPRHLA